MGKTPHPTPHTPHPAPRKNIFSRPYLGSARSKWCKRQKSQPDLSPHRGEELTREKIAPPLTAKPSYFCQFYCLGK
ncbi:MAG: hypothetical protein O9332_03545 [Microcystis sp. LE19-10.1B]|nr:hypothetical protein [Microcystis sp. LE19-10.1B]